MPTRPPQSSRSSVGCSGFSSVPSSTWSSGACRGVSRSCPRPARARAAALGSGRGTTSRWSPGWSSAAGAGTATSSSPRGTRWSSWQPGCSSGPSAGGPGYLAPLPAFLYLAAISVALALIDLDVKRLPDPIVLSAYPVGLVLLGIATAVFGDWSAMLRAVVGAVALFAFYFVLMIVREGGMGFGDVKLAGVLGLYLAWVGWSALVVGGLSAFLIGGAGRRSPSWSSGGATAEVRRCRSGRSCSSARGWASSPASRWPGVPVAPGLTGPSVAPATKVRAEADDPSSRPRERPIRNQHRSAYRKG